MKYVLRTDIGSVRHNNEDTGLSSERYALVAVADGMGGHNAGEVASSMAMGMLIEKCGGAGIITPDDIVDALREANASIVAASRESGRDGMGTTMTCAKIYPEKLVLGHVGDTTAFLMSGGKLTKLTRDHTYVQRLLSMGLINKKQAAEHPQRHMLTNCVGVASGFFADAFEHAWSAGDILLICSDGLTDCVSADEIRDRLLVSGTAAADELVEMTLKRGGHDNVTIAVCRNGGEVSYA